MLPYHLLSSREPSRALLLDDVHRGVLINKGKVWAGQADFVSELQRRVGVGPCCGRAEPGGGSLGSAERLGSGALPAGVETPPALRHKNKTLRCYGFKGKPKGYCQGKALPCCPGGSCGHFQGELRGRGESGMTAKGPRWETRRAWGARCDRWGDNLI